MKKIKAEIIEGIDSPPMDHHMGHLNPMMHPLKHEFRLEICNAARSPIHQLVVVKTSSVFVNDAEEAVNVLNTLERKGPMYIAWRLNAQVPDILTADDKDWETRNKGFGSAISALSLKSTQLKAIQHALATGLKKASEDGSAYDLSANMSYVAMDSLCLSAFGYSLEATGGRDEGRALYRALQSLATKQAKAGLFGNHELRDISPEEEKAAKDTWNAFLDKLLGVVKANAQNDPKDHPFCAALVNWANNDLEFPVDLANNGKTLEEADKDGIRDLFMQGEIHQLLRHGHEALGGVLTWVFVALHRHPKIRQSLEKDITSTAAGFDSEYLGNVIKETLRKYPTCGNTTVRSVDSDDGYKTKTGGYTVPKGTSIFVHMFSLQNTKREWDKPNDFLPERWEAAREGKKASAPGCPFSFSSASASASPSLMKADANGGDEGESDVYAGVGHRPHSLSYFPFSTGKRTCLGRGLALQVIQAVVQDVAQNYRLDPYKLATDAGPDGMDYKEPGKSAFATIVPLHEKSTRIEVRAIPKSGTLSLGAAVADLIKDMKPKDGGWADADSDDDDVPDLVD